VISRKAVSPERVACTTRDLLDWAERVRRGAFPCERAARQARDELLRLSCEERTAQNWTVKRWLQYWIAGRTRIRPTTTANYTHDIQRFLIPTIGSLTLARLSTRQLTAAFAEIGKATNRYGHRHTVCTLQHLHRTLRAALNAAVRDGAIATNPLSGWNYRPANAHTPRSGRRRAWPRGRPPASTPSSRSGPRNN
jgi:integrase-like protein